MLKYRRIIETVFVKFIQNTTVKIQEVVNKNIKGLRYYILGYGKCGKYGRKCFETLWKEYCNYLQSRKLDAQKTRVKILNWIINALPVERIKNKEDIYLVDYKRRYYIA